MKITEKLLAIALFAAFTIGGCPMTEPPDNETKAGACCLADDSCIDSNDAECEMMNGRFEEGMDCADVVCGELPPVMGACCLSNGECAFVDVATCDAVNGVFQANTSCAAAACPGDSPDLGACCLPNGQCASVSAAACGTLDGVFTAGQECSAIDCTEPVPPSGSCCLDNGMCVDADSEICELLDGAFNEGQTCDSTNCPQPAPPEGACCLIDGTCVEATLPECNALDGTLTADAECADVSCPLPTAQELKLFGEQFESDLRSEFKVYYDTMSGIGREYWNLNGNNARWTGELLGKEGTMLDPAGFIVHNNFAIQFRIIRRANRLIQAAQNADPPLTMQQVSSTMGFAKTIQAYCLLLVLNQQFTNGILPIEQIDNQLPQNQFLSYAASLQYIADLLDEAATLLTNGGAKFVFDDMTVVFADFKTPATFRQFNRAISARVRLYQGNKPGAISGIAGSFFNINGAMNAGPKFEYSFERRNPMFREHDVDLMTVHPDFLADADAGDLRVSGNTRMYMPSATLVVPVMFDGLAGDRQLSIVNTDTMPFSLFTNSELILIYAEAQIGSDVNEVLAAINRVRNAAGLGNYLGATDDASLLNEVIKQRRYTLFGLGHRWLDLRRTGKIGQVNIDRPGDVVHVGFPRPTELKAALGQ